MKRQWLIPVGLALLGAVLFLIAPTQERIFNVVLQDVYGQSQIVRERDWGSKADPWHEHSADVKVSSGTDISVFYYVMPTRSVAKKIMESNLKNSPPHSDSSVLIGEERALLSTSRSDQNSLEFQRDNLFILVCVSRESSIPGDAAQIAAIETTARTLDLALVKRQASVQAETVSIAYCLKAELMLWWREEGQDKWRDGRDRLWNFLSW